MFSLGVGYHKRFKMERPLAGLPRAMLPCGYGAVAWNADLLEAHAEVLAGCFRGSQDAILFPSLGSRDGCAHLLAEVVRRKGFIPEATWLIVGPEGPCGTIQALRERIGLAAIQNVGILPAHQNKGLGRALLLRSLGGMVDTGYGRVLLEVTADNFPALRLYSGLGFRRTRVIYKAVPLRAGDDSAIVI
ncbi:MAG: N-acetyltransferase [Planctomycetia bacterium]|nr:N-acetyltransferase [Planctomycetia bacterium]